MRRKKNRLPDLTAGITRPSSFVFLAVFSFCCQAPAHTHTHYTGERMRVWPKQHKTFIPQLSRLFRAIKVQTSHEQTSIFDVRVVVVVKRTDCIILTHTVWHTTLSSPSVVAQITGCCVSTSSLLSLKLAFRYGLLLNALMAQIFNDQKRKTQIDATTKNKPLCILKRENRGGRGAAGRPNVRLWEV